MDGIIVIKKIKQSHFPLKVFLIVTEKKEQSNGIFNDGYELFGLFWNSSKTV